MAMLIMFIVLGFQMFFAHVLGATLSLHASPGQFQVNLTRTLTLRCSVHDTPPTGSGSVIGRRDVTSASGDIKFLTSLVVMRNGMGEHVASVTEHTPAVGRVDPDNLHVTGDLVQTAAQKGYLDLSWTFPLGPDASDYVCEANGIDADGHSVVLTKSVEVGLSLPECDDLVTYIHDHELRLVGLNVTQTSDINELRTNASNQEAKIANIETKCQTDTNTLQTQITSQTSEINDLKAKATSQQTEIAHMQNQINQIMTSQKHIETGTIQCGGSSSYTGRVGSYWYKDITTSFSKAYDRTPIVYLSVNSLDTHADTNTNYVVYVTGTYANKFDMRCKSYHDGRIVRMDVTWISFSH